jgi:SynChlorMet cassette protein ScmD
MVINVERLATNPMLVLREEFDDWGLLFDPDTGDTYGLNPVGVFVWKRIDGQHKMTDILKALSQSCRDVPSDAEQYVTSFIDDLVEKGFVGNEYKEG